MHNELPAQKYETQNDYKQYKITKCITCEKRKWNEKNAGFPTMTSASSDFMTFENLE